MPAPLIGHLQAQTQLAKLLETQRFPHAILLHGPRGIGKALFAAHLAHRLICGKDNEMNMLDGGEGAPLAYNTAAPQAAQIAAGSCPDYHLLAPEDGKKSISIKQVRANLEVLLRSADTARTIIIDALEDLTPEAANTLLKTLEEPRPGIYFILISHQLSAVLPTIRSRARLQALRPLSPAETAEVLRNSGASPTLAALAHGAPGSVLGQGGEARLKLLETLRSGQIPPLSSPDLLPTLLQYLAAQPPSLATAQAYARIAGLYNKQQDINLPLALVNEAALALKPSP